MSEKTCKNGNHCGYHYVFNKIHIVNYMCECGAHSLSSVYIDEQDIHKLKIINRYVDAFRFIWNRVYFLNRKKVEEGSKEIMLYILKKALEYAERDLVLYENYNPADFKPCYITIE